jgi:flagellar basal body rod protein FlgG
MDNGLYAVAADNANNAAGGVQTFVRPGGTTLIQNSLEKSNVDMNRELSLLMEAQRSFQACSTILKGIDQINQKAASQIGSL